MKAYHIDASANTEGQILYPWGTQVLRQSPPMERPKFHAPNYPPPVTRKGKGNETTQAIGNSIREKQMLATQKGIASMNKTRICRSCEDAFIPTRHLITDCSWCDALEGPNS